MNFNFAVFKDLINIFSLIDYENSEFLYLRREI